MKSFNKISSIMISLLGVVSVACIASFIMICIYGVRSDIFKPDDERSGNEPISKLEKTDDYGDYYINNMVFIGDSTISAIKDADILHDESLVWSGIDGKLPLDYNTKNSSLIYTKDGKTASAAQAAEIYKPQYIVITIGIENGVGYCSEEKFKEYYKSLVSSIQDASPETRIILQSVFPVSRAAEKNDPSISNSKIDTANMWISELAGEMSLRYLHTTEILKNEKGVLDSKFDGGNGISLNKDGYEAVLNYIRFHGYR